MTTNKFQKNSGGFTPTPILMLFRFFKKVLLSIANLVQELSSLGNNGETKKPHQNWCRGFTLIETLIAISILLVAVVAPISLIGDALHKLYYAKDEMVAINLAQEGIEVVRQVRDSNMLDGVVAWDNGMPASDYLVDTGALTLGTSPLISCGVAGSCVPQPIYLDGATGLYRQNVAGTPTQFSRVTSIESSGLGTYERKVTARVTWKTGGDTGTVSTTEYLFKWATPNP